jgi:hypothetical protein
VKYQNGVGFPPQSLVPTYKYLSQILRYNGWWAKFSREGGFFGLSVTGWLSSMFGKQRVLGLFVGHDDWVNAIAFSPGGKFLASGGKTELSGYGGYGTGSKFGQLKGTPTGLSPSLSRPTVQ